MNIVPGAVNAKIFFFVAHKWAKEVRVFVPSKPLQPSVIQLNALLGPSMYYEENEVLWIQHSAHHAPGFRTPLTSDPTSTAKMFLAPLDLITSAGRLLTYPPSRRRWPSCWNTDKLYDFRGWYSQNYLRTSYCGKIGVLPNELMHIGAKLMALIYV